MHGAGCPDLCALAQTLRAEPWRTRAVLSPLGPLEVKETKKFSSSASWSSACWVPRSDSLVWKRLLPGWEDASPRLGRAGPWEERLAGRRSEVCAHLGEPLSSQSCCVFMPFRALLLQEAHLARWALRNCAISSGRVITLLIRVTDH